MKSNLIIGTLLLFTGSTARDIKKFFLDNAVKTIKGL